MDAPNVPDTFADAPVGCPACEIRYDPVTAPDTGLMVNRFDNER